MQFQKSAKYLQILQLKFTLFVALLLCLNFPCLAQDDKIIFNYYSDIGNYYLFKKDTLKAVKLFDSIQNLFPDLRYPNPKIIYDLGRKKEALRSYEMLCESGIYKDFFKEYYEYDKLSKQEKRQVDKAFLRFEKNKNVRLCNLLDSLINLDQKVRMELDYSLPDSIMISQLQKVDTPNFNCLYREIKANGFFKIEDIGRRGYNCIDFMIQHGMRYFDEEDTLFQFFQIELKKEIIYGEYNILGFAQNYDQYQEWIQKKGQYYGSYFDENNLIHTDYSIPELNEHRKSIGLGPIEHYLEMKGGRLVKSNVTD
jgi:hypothetical protein